MILSSQVGLGSINMIIASASSMAGCEILPIRILSNSSIPTLVANRAKASEIVEFIWSEWTGNSQDPFSQLEGSCPFSHLLFGTSCWPPIENIYAPLSKGFPALWPSLLWLTRPRIQLCYWKFWSQKVEFHRKGIDLGWLRTILPQIDLS